MKSGFSRLWTFRAGLIVLGSIIFIAGIATGAIAQFSQPIRIVLGVPTGGATDIYVRLVAEHMGKTLGQPVIVENKPGANGNIAAQYVAQQPANGRVIWAGTASMTEINPSVYKSMGWKTEDFIPLIRGIEAPLVLVVNPSVPAKTFPELVAWVKANPGKYGYASFSPGTPSHFLGYLMSKNLGLDLSHIPYAGQGPQVASMLNGEALIGFTQIAGSLEHIREGRLRAIATTGERRFRELPDVVTLAELGHPEFCAAIWFGLLVRTGTPQSDMDRLLNAAKAAHFDPDIRKRLEDQGFEVSGASGPELVTDIRRQIERWAVIVRETGFKAE